MPLEAATQDVRTVAQAPPGGLRLLGFRDQQLLFALQVEVHRVQLTVLQTRLQTRPRALRKQSDRCPPRGQRSSSYLQCMDGDGAAPPAVQVADGVHRRRAAEQHQPAEQLLLGHGEQDLEESGVWGQTGRQAGRQTDRQAGRQTGSRTCRKTGRKTDGRYEHVGLQMDVLDYK